MGGTWAQQLQSWNNFYVIVGTAAAGLTGLMFVVVSLSTRAAAERREEGVRAFVTPTVVFFATVLAVGALMTVPSISAGVLGSVLALGGLGLLGYMFSRRGHKIWKENALGRDDWLAYIGLPVLCYALLLLAGVCVWARAPFGLELLGLTAILLLLVGVRNAWDLVLWMVQQQRPD